MLESYLDGERVHEKASLMADERDCVMENEKGSSRERDWGQSMVSLME